MNFEHMNDKELKDYFKSTADIPATVNEKWDIAKNMVLNDDFERGTKNRRKILPLVVKSISAVAASFVLLLGVCYANPVLAQNLPFAENILEFLGNRSTSATDPFVATTPVSDLAENTESSNATTDAYSVLQTYSDGNVLVFSLNIPMEEEFSHLPYITPNMQIKINGEIALASNDNLPSMRLTSTGTGFIGAFSIPISDILPANTNSFTLETEVTELSYTDENTLILSETAELQGLSPDEQLKELENWDLRELQALSYENLPPVYFDTALSSSNEVTISNDNLTVYDIAEVQNDCTINTITTSPVSTFIDADIPDNVLMLVTDNMGNTIENIIPQRSFSIYHPLYTGTESLSFEFINMDNKNEVIAKISVPITNGGYKEKTDVDSSSVINNDVITFIPDISALAIYEGDSYENRTADEIVYGLDEPIEVTTVDDGTQILTISNLQIYDSISDAGIDPSATLDSSTDSQPGAKFVTIDVIINNNNAVGIEYNEGENNFFISSYISPAARTIYDDEATRYSNPLHTEIAYFDNAGKSVKGYYSFELTGDEVMTAKVGFFWDEKALSEDNLQLMLDNQDGYSIIEVLE